MKTVVVLIHLPLRMEYSRKQKHVHSIDTDSWLRHRDKCNHCINYGNKQFPIIPGKDFNVLHNVNVKTRKKIKYPKNTEACSLTGINFKRSMDK